VSKEGITLYFSSTSATQVHALFVSFIVYDASTQNLVTGSYLYKEYLPVRQLSHTPPIGITNNNLAFCGLNGFVITNSGSDFSFDSILDNGRFRISSS
jgi:hypothetical protein